MERRERLLTIDRNTTVSQIEGSAAFNLVSYEKKEREFTDAEIRDDIISYLGEYRLNVQKYNYNLQFSGDSLASLRLRDSNQGEPMIDKARRAIDVKKLRGEPTYREEAELFGMENLENQLRFANSGDTVFWASPPGSKEEGYGDYAFLFKGKVQRIDSNRVNLIMTAIRIENPSLEQFNKAMTILTENTTNYSKAQDFLMNPKIIPKDIASETVDNVLRDIFDFRLNLKDQQVCNKVIDKMRPMIDEFIEFVKYAPKEKKLEAFYALENFALHLKEQYEQKEKEGVIFVQKEDPEINLVYLTSKFGYEPPKAVGSCGSTNRAKSNNILTSGYQALMNALFGEENEWFTCPKCGWKADGPIGNGPCGGCGLTKEQYAKESGKEVCE